MIFRKSITIYLLLSLSLLCGCKKESADLVRDTISFNLNFSNDIVEDDIPTHFVLAKYVNGEYVDEIDVDLTKSVTKNDPDGWSLFLMYNRDLGNLTLENKHNPNAACLVAKSLEVSEGDVEGAKNGGVVYKHIESLTEPIFIGNSGVCYNVGGGENIKIDVVPRFLKTTVNLSFDSGSLEQIVSCSATVTGMATRLNIMQEEVEAGNPGYISIDFHKVSDESLDYDYTAEFTSLGVDLSVEGSLNTINIDMQLANGLSYKRSSDLTKFFAGASGSGALYVDIRLFMSVTGNTGGSVDVDTSWGDTNIIPID